MKRIFWKITSALAFSFLLIFLPLKIWIKYQAAPRMLKVDAVLLNRDVAMVLGAGVSEEGKPSRVLEDRLKTGIQLYKKGMISHLLLSGDNRPAHAFQTDVMKAYVTTAGIPEQAILIDEKGYRTFESCENAKEVFNISKMFVVSQSFHLPRALYLCKAFGIDALGVEADLSTYSKSSRFYWNLRELAASVKAFFIVQGKLF